VCTKLVAYRRTINDHVQMNDKETLINLHGVVAWETSSGASAGETDLSRGAEAPRRWLATEWQYEVTQCRSWAVAVTDGDT